MAKYTHEETLDILLRSKAARRRGDVAEASRLSRLPLLAPHLAKSLKEVIGPDALLKEGFDLSEAEEAYGKDWLYS